jgi:hypothetical protein
MKKQFFAFIFSISLLIFSCQQNSNHSISGDSLKSDPQDRDSVNYDWEVKNTLAKIFNEKTITEKLDSAEINLECKFVKDGCEEVHPSDGQNMNDLLAKWSVKNYPDWSEGQTEIELNEDGKLFWIQLSLQGDDDVMKHILKHDLDDGQWLVIKGKYFRSKLNNKPIIFFIANSLEFPLPL